MDLRYRSWLVTTAAAITLLTGLGMPCYGQSTQSSFDNPDASQQGRSKVGYSVIDIRIKDLTHVEGVRSNKLMGMGLVTGLKGTGGNNPETREFALNMTQKFASRFDPQVRAVIRNDTKSKTNNLSVVTVSAELPPFAFNGQEIDIVVSAFDDAKSLQGGVLMLTPLTAVDGEIYAMANGQISIGGFSFAGQGASVQKNHATTGRIPDGATIEKTVCPTDLGKNGRVRLFLRNSDLQTAARISNAINEFHSGAASVVDPRTVLIHLPRFQAPGEMHTYLAKILDLRVVPDTAARVVINERTGTVIVGENVRLSRVAITHANLAIVTGERPQVSQPSPFSGGQTTVVPRTDIQVTEEKSSLNVIDSSASVVDLARALNALGVTPRDLSSIFQQLKASGALHAELVFE